MEVHVRRTEKRGRNMSRGGRGGGRLPAAAPHSMVGATAPEEPEVEPGSPVWGVVCCMHVRCVYACVVCVCLGGVWYGVCVRIVVCVFMHV